MPNTGCPANGLNRFTLPSSDWSGLAAAAADIAAIKFAAASCIKYILVASMTASRKTTSKPLRGKAQ